MFAFYTCHSIVLVRNHDALYGTYAFAGLIGGFLAGRASRTKTIIEPALASLLVTLSFYLFSVVINLDNFSDELHSLDVPISQALIAFAAAVAGGKLGERMQPRNVPHSMLWWGGLTALIVMGTYFICTMLLGSVFELLDAEMSTFPFLLLLFGAPVVAGVITQVAAPFPIAGKMPCMTLYWSIGIALVVLIVEPGLHVLAIFFATLIGGLIVSVFAAIGATLVCKWAPSWMANDQAQLTTARALDAD